MVMMPAEHAYRTITRTDEMKEMSVEEWWNEICGRRILDKPRENPLFRPPQYPYEMTETP